MATAMKATDLTLGERLVILLMRLPPSCSADDTAVSAAWSAVEDDDKDEDLLLAMALVVSM